MAFLGNGSPFMRECNIERIAPCARAAVEQALRGSAHDIFSLHEETAPPALTDKYFAVAGVAGVALAASSFELEPFVAPPSDQTPEQFLAFTRGLVNDLTLYPNITVDATELGISLAMEGVRLAVGIFYFVNSKDPDETLSTLYVPKFVSQRQPSNRAITFLASLFSQEARKA